MFDKDFGKYGPIFKILSPHTTKISTFPAVQYVATIPHRGRYGKKILGPKLWPYGMASAVARAYGVSGGLALSRVQGQRPWSGGQGRRPP